MVEVARILLLETILHPQLNWRTPQPYSPSTGSLCSEPVVRICPSMNVVWPKPLRKVSKGVNACCCCINLFRYFCFYNITSYKINLAAGLL